MARGLLRGVALVLLCVLVACTSNSGDDSDPPADEQTTTERQSGSEPFSEDDTDGTLSGSRDGRDASRAPVEDTELQWRTSRLADKGMAAATRKWTAAADSLGKKVTITGPGPTQRFRVRAGRVQAVEMQWPWAVVYAGGSLVGPQQTQQGQLAVFDLRNGKRRMVGDAGSAPPPAASGAISMHDGELAYATGSNRDYCLARLQLASLDGHKLDCAKPGKEGFTQFRLTPAGFGFTSFDNRRPSSCMTLKSYYDNTSHTLQAAKRCIGWEVVPGEDSAVWLQVRNPNRVERARAYAHTPDAEVIDLGPAITGSTTWCGGATYFVRPATRDGRADELMRWSPDGGLERVWQASGNSVAYVFAPHCGGSTVTLPGFDRQQRPIIMTAPA